MCNFRSIIKKGMNVHTGRKHGNIEQIKTSDRRCFVKKF